MAGTSKYMDSPEDLHNYENLFLTVKLATRMHDNPRKVIAAYTSGNYKGNLLDLMEPGYAPIFGNTIIDNKLFPEDWFTMTSHCSSNCDDYQYCKRIYQTVCRNI